MSTLRVLLAFTAGLVLAVALQITAPPAEACGGFFCANDPVDQTGERILFTMNGDGTVTSLVEIQYEGFALAAVVLAGGVAGIGYRAGAKKPAQN